MKKPSRSDEAKRQKTAVESLRQQIEQLVEGRSLPTGRPTFREFIERKMAEDRQKEATKGVPAKAARPRKSAAKSKARAPRKKRGK